MVYTFIQEHDIKILSLSKTLFGQYHNSFFSKTHTISLLNDGVIENVDLVASALKEAVTQAKPNPISDKEIFLILPQESFIFARYTIPGDISDAAIISFVKDKLRADQSFDTEELLHDFIVTKTDEGCVVLFYGMKKEIFAKYDDAFRLLGLSIKKIIPESLSYFKLFSKSLPVEKQEKVAYIEYDENSSFGFIFDPIGLVSSDRINLKNKEPDAIKSEFEDIQKEQNITLNRIILAGTKSKDVRQDYFTKDVGIWTNPLEKIIQNYHGDYVKLLLPTKDAEFSLLEFAVCFGGFIFDSDKDQFQPLEPNNKVQIQSQSNNQSSMPRITFVKKRDVIIFIISFLASCGLILSASKVKSLLVNDKVADVNTPTTQPTKPPKPINSPTPSVKREDIKVKILNGTGISGKASEYATVLKDKNYSEVLTGNADSFDVQETELQIKEGQKDIELFIKSDLESYLKFTKTTVLAKDEPADAVIVIGLDSE